MAGITLAQAEAKLSAWLDAEDRIQEAQSYTVSVRTSSRTVQRATLSQIREQVEYWDRQVKRLSRGGIRVRGATIANE